MFSLFRRRNNDVLNGFNILGVYNFVLIDVSVGTVDGLGIVTHEDLDHHDICHVDLLVAVGIALKRLSGLEGLQHDPDAGHRPGLGDAC